MKPKSPDESVCADADADADAGRRWPRREQAGAVETVEDAYLVRRAQDGYLDAYAELVARHAPRAYRVALRMLGNHHDAQDITQDALIAAWQGINRFRADASFATWLYRIVTTRCLNKIGRTRWAYSIDAVPEIPESRGDPAEQAENAAAADAVATAITKLPGPQRIALVLRQFEGLSYADIAEITNSTVPAVRSHLHRARRTLANTLQDWR